MPNGWGQFNWGNWLYGLFAGFIGGGAGAVVSGISVSMLDPQQFSIGSGKFFTLMAVVFLAHGTISAMMFLKDHPLPDQVKTVTTVETVEHQQHPAATVTTTIQETKITSEPKP